jgi:uncharacterized protein YndB with AHSA1/START domain
MRSQLACVESDCEIMSARVLNVPREIVFKAMTEPEHLKNWWGPKGFTNTFNEFDMRPGGKWSFVMHGPDKGNYRNECVFMQIVKPELVSWDRLSEPKFQMFIKLEEPEPQTTKVIFRMVFATPELCTKVRPFAREKNEENFDRLEAELKTMPLHPRP